MVVCSWPKPVYVITYLRFRFNRWERVSRSLSVLPFLRLGC